MKSLPVILIVVAFGAIAAIAFMVRAKPPGSSPPEKAPAVKLPKPKPQAPPSASPPPAIPRQAEESKSIYADLKKPAPNAAKAESNRLMIELLVKNQLANYLSYARIGKRDGQSKRLAGLRENRELALRYAQEELNQAKTDEERKAIHNAIEEINKDP